MHKGRFPHRRMQVLNWLRENRGMHTTREIGDAIGYRSNNVLTILRKLIEQNQVVQVARGKYMAV